MVHLDSFLFITVLHYVSCAGRLMKRLADVSSMSYMAHLWGQVKKSTSDDEGSEETKRTLLSWVLEVNKGGGIAI